MGFTAEQQHAIDSRADELLVSAAAGSGKTAVLIERIVNMITTEPVDIDRLLVVTFTEAAANEMRQRLSAELYERRQRDPNNENLQRQLMLLPRASISTIHKFCADVIRRCFHLTDLDPGFKIADETEIKLLRSQIIDELFEEHYSAGDEDFFRLVDYYGGGKTKDSGLSELVLELCAFTSGFPWPKLWLERAAEMYNISSPDTAPWALALKEELLRKLDGIEASANYAAKLALRGAEKYLSALQNDISIVEELRTGLALGLGEFRERLFNVKHEELKRYSAKDVVDPEIKKTIQDIRKSEIKQGVADFKKIFMKPMEELLQDIAQLYPVQKSLVALVMEFMELFGEAKRRRNIADFNDLEQYALNVLLKPGSDEHNPIPSEAAYEFRERFVEVMIDEYQDSNLVQELILSAVAPRKFMVGDVKQSIYKFRGAKPELFMEKYRLFAQNSNIGTRIDLSRNFRSRKCVLDAVNLMFYQLMTAQGGVLYDKDSALYSGADFLKTDLNASASTEIYLIDTESDEEDVSGAELEAMVVARRINEIVSEPLYIFDNGEYRRAGFRDIVIILRSLRGGAVEIFLDVLQRSGIPAYANTSTGYFESVEVMTALSFLQVIDNPLQDIPLLAVLRSPVYGLSDEQLLEIRANRQNDAFYDCVKTYSGVDDISHKLERFMSDLAIFRREAAYLPISALIDSVYTATDYFNYVAAMPSGAVRQANLRLLREKAAQYEQTSYSGLFNFILYMRRIKDKSDGGDAKALAENADLVRIMTAHKSKGLEFPVVFVSLLGRGFSRSDERNAVVMHEQLGLGSVHIDTQRRIKSNTLPRIAMIKKLRQESLSEELRVLYVALTRAREKLILTGGANLSSKRDKWLRHVEHPGIALPDYAIFDANNYLDWIVPAIHREGLPITAEIDLHYKTYADIFGGGPVDSAGAWTALHSLEGDYDAQACRDMTWKYPLAALAALPAKLSISEIKRLHDQSALSGAVAYNPPPPVYEKPRFLRESLKPTSANRGAIIHAVLEHMDLTRVNTEHDLRQLVSALVAKGIISAHESEAVDYDALCEFNRSEIMQRIIAAGNAKRETPFVIGLSPHQIYRRPEFADSDACILVHGIIDCYFEENGNLVLVDYKTGYAGNIERVLDTYSVQMSVYKLALERATGKNVSEALLYLFEAGQAVHARILDL